MEDPSYDGFAWRETRPGVWERDIDEAERFYSHLIRAYEGSGRMFFAVTGHVSLAIDVAADSSPEETSARIDSALRHAWLKMRFDCPTIASQVIWDWSQGRLRKVYETFNGDASQRFWLDQTFRILDNGQTGAQFANSDPPAPALATLFVVKPPHLTPHQVRRDLVLRAPHDIIDGVGTLHLLNSLIANAVNPFKMQNFYAPPVFGSEVQRLSAPLRVAASISPTLSSQQRIRLSELAAQNTAVKTGVEIATVPYRAGALVPGRHQRVAVELTEYQTQAVLQACKRVQATVTHAFHAAVALAIRDRQQRTPKQRKVRYVSYILANERPQCSFGTSQHAAAIYRCSVPSGAPQQTQHAAAVYHSVPAKSLSVDLTVPHVNRDIELAERNEEFRAILVHMRNFYRGIRDDKEHIHFSPASWAERTPAWFPRDDGRPPTIPAPNAAPNVSISSMGLIDGIIRPEQGPFRVYSPWVTGEELGTGLGVFLGTFRGRLELSAAYNDAWHDEAEVQVFLNDCWRAVREGLGLSV
jgi:hypothetical protein